MQNDRSVLWQFFFIADLMVMVSVRVEIFREYLRKVGRGGEGGILPPQARNLVRVGIWTIIISNIYCIYGKKYFCVSQDSCCFLSLCRNYGMGDTDCLLDMKPLKHQNCEFTITVGKHKATVSFLSLVNCIRWTTWCRPNELTSAEVTSAKATRNKTSSILRDACYLSPIPSKEMLYCFDSSLHTWGFRWISCLCLGACRSSVRQHASDSPIKQQAFGWHSVKHWKCCFCCLAWFIKVRLAVILKHKFE